MENADQTTNADAQAAAAADPNAPQAGATITTAHREAEEQLPDPHPGERQEPALDDHKIAEVEGRHFVYLPIIGGTVQFIARDETKHDETGHGPYAALITRVLDADKGIVCLRVFPAFLESYTVSAVEYDPESLIGKPSWRYLHDDPADD